MICESAALRITEIDRVEDLEDLRLTWNALWPRTLGGSFYHTLDWLQVYWRHFGAGQRLRVLLVTSGSTPIGILPLTVVTEPTRLGRLRVLTYPLQDWGTYFGPIGPNPTATLTLAMRHVEACRRDWDLLDLRWVNRDEHDHCRTPWAMERAGFAARESLWKTVAMIDMECDWQTYWMSRSAKLRQNVRRNEGQLRRLGAVEYIRYRPAGAARGDGDPRWDLYEACLDVARASWQGRSTNGTTLSHESVEPYFRASHERAAKLGMLDLNLMTLDGRPVAFFYNYHCDGNIVGTRRGHLESLARQGIGNVLFSRMLSDSWARGDRSLDLGPGTMGSKARWCTRFAHSYRYTHYPRLVPRAQLLRLKHWMVGRRDLDELAADDIVGGDRDKSPVDAGYFGSTPVSINK
jgi:CelD/BcsL family acetyltransferase involved in cellulose biosynthesis